MIAVNQSTSAASDRECGAIFDLAPQPYLVTDGHGTVWRANRAARNFLARGESLDGTLLASLLPVEMRRRLRRFIGRLHQDEPAAAFFDLHTTTGRLVPCRASATLIVDGIKREPRILWLISDESDLRRAAQDALDECNRLEEHLSQQRNQLQQAVAQLQDATSHKDHFLAMMSHELRTPLTVLVGGARILHSRLENVPSDDRRELLADMLRHGQRLQQLIENLMVLARGQGIELETVSLRHLLTNIVFSYQFADPGLKVRLQVPEELPQVCGSTLGIEQVVRNVLSNARLHGTSDKPVDITARKVGRYVTVSLRDHGPGIDETELKSVFEPYKHAVDAPQGATGTGIGLTVSRRLMRAQHGGIWAKQPSDGPGAKFTLALPVAEGLGRSAAPSAASR